MGAAQNQVIKDTEKSYIHFELAYICTLVRRGKNRRHVFMSSQERRVRELRSCFALYIYLFIYLFIYFPIFIQDLPLQQG